VQQTVIATERLESVRMIRDSVGAIASPADLGRIRRLRSDPIGIDRQVWRRIADLGWLALRLGEDQGGLGLGMHELAAIGGELGAALVPEPVSSVAAIVPLLSGELKDQVVAGDRIVLPAWQERSRVADEFPCTQLKQGRVTGVKILVPFAEAANGFLLSTANGLVYVDRAAQGVSLSTQRTQDGASLSTVSFNAAETTPIAGDLDAALHELALAHAAYLLGAAERAFAMTLDYLRVRRQFGRLIGSFQVLQHRAAEAKIQLALSRAVLDEALNAVDDGLSEVERIGTASRALARISDTAMLIARESIQMHGAIGITDEHNIGLYCRKILTIYNLFGTAGTHRSRYLAAAGVGSAT
jgi:alkylation response protein AidB-like acyl-CoA dehydrogenase